MSPTSLAVTTTTIQAIEASYIQSYMASASGVLLVVDYLQTLPDEVRLMWKTTPSFMKALFFMVRYYPFAHACLFLVYCRHGDPQVFTGSACQPFNKAVAFSSMLVFLICNAVLTVRVYAFSQRAKGMIISLLLLYAVIWAAGLVMAYRTTRQPHFATYPRGVRLGCIILEEESDQRLTATLLFGGVFMITCIPTAIMVYIALREHRDSTASLLGGIGLIQMFLRDGLVYCLCMTFLIIVNIIFIQIAPQHGTQLALTQFTTHSNAILTGRMLMDLRRFSRTVVGLDTAGAIQRRPATTSFYSTNLQFAGGIQDWRAPN